MNYKVYSLCVLRKSCLDFSPHATIFVFWPSLSVKVLFTALTKLEWIPPHSPRSDDITTTKLLGLAFSASLGVISTFSYKAAKNIHELGWGKIIESTVAESYFNPWVKSVSKVLAQSKIGNETFTPEKKNEITTSIGICRRKRFTSIPILALTVYDDQYIGILDSQTLEFLNHQNNSIKKSSCPLSQNCNVQFLKLPNLSNQFLFPSRLEKAFV